MWGLCSYYIKCQFLKNAYDEYSQLLVRILLLRANGEIPSWMYLYLFVVSFICSNIHDTIAMKKGGNTLVFIPSSNPANVY